MEGHVAQSRTVSATAMLQQQPSLPARAVRSKLSCMWRRLLSLTLSLVAFVLIENAHAQSASASDTPHAGVALSKLSAPVYPRVAQNAHIQGDVDLTVRVRSDGSLESVVLVSGHAMLRQNSIDSAQRSQFECVDCVEAVTSYALRYKFQISPRDPPRDCNASAEPQPPSPEVDPVRHQVTVFAWELWTCDPTASTTYVRVRSAKCLYLWRCGRNVIR
jgi:Gram-negative bacterial TonB protein C-terminal